MRTARFEHVMLSAFICLFLVWLMIIALSAQAPKAQMEYYRDPGTPETFVVRLPVKDTALVCAEPEKGLVACRPVGEFRTWVRERPKVK